MSLSRRQRAQTMNPDLLAELRRLFIPARPDQTRVAKAEDITGEDEERRMLAGSQKRHSARFHNIGFASLPSEKRTAAVLSHMSEGASSNRNLREQYLNQSSDSIFRSSGLPALLGVYPENETGTYAEYKPGAPRRNKVSDMIAMVPELAGRRGLIHESRHRAHMTQPGFAANRPKTDGIMSRIPYEERPTEQYAELGTAVYDLLARPTGGPQTWYEKTYGVLPENVFPRNREQLVSMLERISSFYPNSPVDAEGVARDLLSGRTIPGVGSTGSIFGAEHPARAMLDVPTQDMLQKLASRSNR